ncbi:cordon-bleu protein-like 1 isoform X3 [Festucalex cinctus]
MKPEGMEDKIKRPYVPEATVRLLINYNKSQKTVLRVNPQLPLEMLLPLVCNKCEMRVETTVLLRDFQSKESLDIAKTLNEHGTLREVFAWDTANNDPLVNHDQPRPHEIANRSTVHHNDPSTGKRKQKEKIIFLSLYRRLKKKAEIDLRAKRGELRFPPWVHPRVFRTTSAISDAHRDPLHQTFGDLRGRPHSLPVGMSCWRCNQTYSNC